MTNKIGFGGGCHWCTEAYFQSLKGVLKVEQGWIASIAPNNVFSEGVIVYFNSDLISLDVLISIHLHTHASTKNHSFREKYRSAIYLFNQEMEDVKSLVSENQNDFEDAIITEVLPFEEFKLNIETQQNYYKKNRGSQFCRKYISPKLKHLEKEYHKYFKTI